MNQSDARNVAEKETETKDKIQVMTESKLSNNNRENLSKGKKNNIQLHTSFLTAKRYKNQEYRAEGKSNRKE